MEGWTRKHAITVLRRKVRHRHRQRLGLAGAHMGTRPARRFGGLLGDGCPPAVPAEGHRHLQRPRVHQPPSAGLCPSIARTDRVPPLPRPPEERQRPRRTEKRHPRPGTGRLRTLRPSRLGRTPAALLRGLRTVPQSLHPRLQTAAQGARWRQSPQDLRRPHDALRTLAASSGDLSGPGPSLARTERPPRPDRSGPGGPASKGCLLPRGPETGGGCSPRPAPTSSTWPILAARADTRPPRQPPPFGLPYEATRKQANGSPAHRSFGVMVF